MEADSVAGGRSKRQKTDKHGRLAALTKLKQLKGSKYKYEVKEEAPVYEEVDEISYSKIVQERQEDDWIIDDGTGYVEDGREIFDDDLEARSSEAPKNAQKSRKNSFKPPTSKAESSNRKDIKSMFMAQPKKKKVEEAKLDDDDELLGDIMKDIHNNSFVAPSPRPLLLKKKSAAVAAPLRKSLNPFASKRASQPEERIVLKKVVNRLESDSNRDSFWNIDESLSSKSSSGSGSAASSCKKSIENGKAKVIESVSLCSEEEPENRMDDSVIEEFDSQDLFVDDDSTFDDMEIDGNSQNIKNRNETKEFSNSNVAEHKDEIGKNCIVEDAKEICEDFWDDTISANSDLPTANISVDSSNLPLMKNDKGEQVLKFFWLDAYEDFFKHPGTVYLFGKVWIESAKSHVSCCVVVKNIARRVLILPREKKRGTGEPIVMKDVYCEFDAIAEKMKIREYKSKVVQKSYAFEKNHVPADTQYLEVHYSADLPPLPSDFEGSTFSVVFGTGTSSLETLLLDRKLKGPSWIHIRTPKICNPPVSWCKVEVIVDGMQCVEVVPGSQQPPPLVVMAMSLQTVINNATHKSEIVAASCFVHDTFPVDKTAPKPPFKSHFCALAKPSNCIFPFDFKDALRRYNHTRVERTDNERALLAFLLAKIHKIDPDVIVGHDFAGFDLEVLLDRLNENKIPNWSRLGRLKRAVMPKQGGGQRKGAEKFATCGRLVCDVMISAKELIRSPSYDLTELVSQVLKASRKDIPIDTIPKMFSSSEDLLHLIDSCMMDANFVLRLMCELSILPLALQITTIAGNLMSRTLLGGRSERNEFLLLHAFHEKNFIVPDKFRGKAKVESEVSAGGKRGRRKPAYAGGLVLEPKKGFYDKFVLLMDFNSLYPSIIQEYNICFTTVPRVELPKDGDEEEALELPEPGLTPGILPTEIRKLVESRKEVKKLMSVPTLSNDLKQQYDIRQKALKLTANSMYGCLGFSNSRFYAKSLASLITSRGREILLHTKDLVQKMGLDVIYGDTDSIMINTNSTQIEDVLRLGNKIKVEINKLYKLLEIDIDGVYKSILLLKKKKYAALAINRTSDGQMTTTKELKGLDIVRRDWSRLAKNAGEFVIGEILSDKQREDIVERIHSHMMDLGTNVRSGSVPLSHYLITKQLTKNPEEYADKKSVPHVQVALRLNSRGGKQLRQGDTVPYLICQDGSTLAATQRAYHPEELKTNENLKIDTQYYLTQQLLPVISRLCDPIEGTDLPTLAQFLGLDPSNFRQRVRQQETESDLLLGAGTMLDSELRYESCQPLRFSCPGCKGEIAVRSPTVVPVSTENLDTSDFSLLECGLCQTELSQCLPSLRLQLTKSIRRYIKDYYLSWMRCDDPGCAHRTRKVPLQLTRAGPICPMCQKGTLHPEYSDGDLYLQLSFFQYILDLSKFTKKRPGKNDRDGRYESVVYQYRKLQDLVDDALKVDAYGIVNLSQLFEGLYKVSAARPL